MLRGRALRRRQKRVLHSFYRPACCTIGMDRIVHFFCAAPWPLPRATTLQPDPPATRGRVRLQLALCCASYLNTSDTFCAVIVAAIAPYDISSIYTLVYGFSAVQTAQYPHRTCCQRLSCERPSQFRAPVIWSLCPNTGVNRARGDTE